mgnify:CR=1 FL=1
MSSSSNDNTFDAAQYRRAGRGRVYDSIIDTIGDTPLVRLPRLTAELKPKGEVLAKLEFFNPIASVKDRLGASMISSLEHQGLIKPGTTIVEPTSGNTGIALAFVCAAKGYPLILVMPESMSIERRKMLALLGAKLELTPAEKGMRGAVNRAQELLSEIPGSVMPQQFENSANPLIHRVSTAEEIWNDTAGSVDAVVSGVGTGGTISGIGQVKAARIAARIKQGRTGGQGGRGHGLHRLHRRQRTGGDLFRGHEAPLLDVHRRGGDRAGLGWVRDEPAWRTACAGHRRRHRHWRGHRRGLCTARRAGGLCRSGPSRKPGAG